MEYLQLWKFKILISEYRISYPIYTIDLSQYEYTRLRGFMIYASSTNSNRANNQ